MMKSHFCSISTAVALMMAAVHPSFVRGQERPENAEPQSAEVTGPLGMRMVRVQPGTYLRGFDTDDRREHAFALAHPYSNRQEFKNETPAHQVRISQPFEIAATEVTVGQFKAFVEDTGYVTEAEKSGGALGCFPDEKDYVDRFHRDPAVTWKSPGFEQTDAHPVVAVSWNDAVAFCRWLSQRESQTYRLPSEAEWEFACRASRPSWYAWGEDPDLAYEHANVADGALEAAQPWTTRYQRAVRLDADQGDGFALTAPVGSFKPNAWGIHDMHGNVWEWCHDRWSADLYRRYFDDVPRQKRKDVVVTDPVFDRETEQHAYGDWRVMRGGAWTCAPAAVRCSIRTFAEASDASVYTGFRVLREVTAP